MGEEMPAILLLIAAGGAVGSVARVRLAAAIHDRVGTMFPWGTLAVNVAGSFALGLALPLLAADAALTPARAFVTVGVLGAFTTFSSFAWEAAELLRERRALHAAAYAVVSVAAGVSFLVLGLLLAGVLM